MSRTIRTERDAFAALAQTIQTQAQTRADWRAVLGQRDARRAERTRNNLQPMKSQHIYRARQAKAEAAEWEDLGHKEKAAQCLRLVRQEVWLARRARAWTRRVCTIAPAFAALIA